MQYYDIFNINIDGTDGRCLGSIIFAEVWHRPVINEKSREDIATKLGFKENELRIIKYDFEGYLGIWHKSYGIPIYRIRRTNRTYIDRATEKACPQCGMLAIDGTFVRGALMCREHGFLFGGC
jgi:hypothetical protein